MIKRLIVGFLAMVALGEAGCFEARGDLFTLEINYSGTNLGVSGSGVLQAISVGGGEYDVISGYINATMPGVGTVYETLVANPNAPNFAQTAVFSNTNGDNFVYDDRVFLPSNAPASPDGAQVTYAGGLVFQTATPSKEDVYLSANTPGSFSGYFYFGGYDRPYGTLGNLSITMQSPDFTDSVSAPEPSSFITVPIAAVCAAAFAAFRRRKIAAV